MQEILRLRHRQKDEYRRQKEEELVSSLYCFFTFIKRFNCFITSCFAPNPLEIFIFISGALPLLWYFLLNLLGFYFVCRLFFMLILLMLKHKRRLKLPSVRSVLPPFLLDIKTFYEYLHNLQLKRLVVNFRHDMTWIRYLLPYLSKSNHDWVKIIIGPLPNSLSWAFRRVDVWQLRC